MESEFLKLSPCKGCERRQVGCHGDCEQYKQFRAELAKKKKQYDIVGSFIRSSIRRKQAQKLRIEVNKNK